MSTRTEAPTEDVAPSHIQAPVSSANIAPNVFFSILDHHARRGEKQTRVIGGLYGLLKSDIVEVRHVVPILHVEVENENATLELGGWQRLQQLGRKINLPPLIGWYATGSHPGDMAVDQMFSMRTAIYVRILMDGGVEHNGLRVRVLGATNVTIRHNTTKMYRHIPFRFVPTNAIEASVLRRAIGSFFPELAIINEDDKLSSLQKLQHEVDTIVELIQGKSDQLSSDTVYEITKTLQTYPRVELSKSKSNHTDALEDASAIKFLVKSIDLLLHLVGKATN